MTEKRRGRWRGFLRLVILATLTAVALGIVGFWGTVIVLDRQLPDVFRFEDYRGEALQTTRILSADGTVLAELFVERRTVVDVERLPPHVVDAVVATEDAGFFEHPGIDVLGIARAMLANLRAGRVRQGGSTITQQVAKTFFLSPERTLWRKLKELVLARKLERKLSKREILALYLNQIYFGHGRYGVEEAARFYFGRPARDLDVAEAALLAGLIRSPERLTPFRHPEAALRRRAHVLRRMADVGRLEPEEAERLAATPLRLADERHPDDGIAGHFVAAVVRDLEARFGREHLRRAGLTVHTTLDPQAQRAANEAVAAGLRRVDERGDFARPLRSLGRGGVGAEERRLRDARGAGDWRSGAIVEGVVAKRDTAAGQYEIALGGLRACLDFSEERRYRAPKRIPGYRVGDVLRVSLRHAPGDDDCPSLNLEMGPQAALVAMDARSRRVLALVGGSDPVARPFDHATQARRQTGSTFKPFVFAAALEAGAVTPSSRFPNRRVSYPGRAGRRWAPGNFDGRHDGREVSLKTALVESLNVVAVQVLRKVGVAKTVALARELGLQGPFPNDLTLALGSAPATPLELTNAFAAFADGGRHRDPILVSRIVDAEGRELYRAEPAEGVQVLSPETAQELHRMLVAVVREGTGRAARLPNAVVAGKTGTTNEGVDTWFVGAVGTVTAGVWVGFDDRRPLRRTGGQVAAPIWADFARAAVQFAPRRAATAPIAHRKDGSP